MRTIAKISFGHFYASPKKIEQTKKFDLTPKGSLFLRKSPIFDNNDIFMILIFEMVL